MKLRLDSVLYHRYWGYVIGFVVLLILYLLSVPGNRTETDDGYWYSNVVMYREYGETFHPRFLIFLTIFKFIYQLVCGIGIKTDAYTLMYVVSALYASGTVLLTYYFFRRRLWLSRTASFISVVFLAFSYQFWRYAVEAEIYSMSSFLIILFLIFLLRIQENPKWILFILCALGSLAVLIYKPNFIPLYLVFPFVFIYLKDYKCFILYFLISGIIILGSYLLVYKIMYHPPDTFTELIMGGTNRPIGSASGAIFILLSNQLAAAWMFGYEGVISFIQSHYPHKVMVEEIYSAKYALTYAKMGLYTLIAFGIVFLISLITLFRNKIQIISRKGFVMLVVWLILHGLFILYFDPTSSEPWLMLEIPIIGIFGVFVIEPLVKAGKTYLVSILLFTFILHNVIGGIMVMKDKEGDYYVTKSEWVIENATENDIIITYGPISYLRYLRYYSEAKIYNVEYDFKRIANLIRKTLANDGMIYFTENINDPPSAILYRSGETYEYFNKMIEKNRWKIVDVEPADDTFTYKLDALDK